MQKQRNKVARQCKHIKWNGERCKQKSVMDSGCCAIHDKRYKPQQKKLGTQNRKLTRLRDLPVFYKKYLTQTLQEVLQEALAQNPREQLQLFEELALMRESAGQAIAMYGIARDSFDQATDAKDREKRAAIVAAAGALMREQLNEVVHVCDTAAKVQANAKDNVSLSALQYIISQLTLCAYEAMGQNIEIAQRFDWLVKNRVRIPVFDERGGTVLTPDQDAIAMDSSVPKDNTIIEIPLVERNGNNHHADSSSQAG